MKIFIISLIVLTLSACDRGQAGYGWKYIVCYNGGEKVYETNWDYCPDWAGEGYAQLADGTVIQAQCRCSTGGPKVNTYIGY